MKLLVVILGVRTTWDQLMRSMLLIIHAKCMLNWIIIFQKNVNWIVCS